MYFGNVDENQNGFIEFCNFTSAIGSFDQEKNLI